MASGLAPPAVERRRRDRARTPTSRARGRSTPSVTWSGAPVSPRGCRSTARHPPVDDPAPAWGCWLAGGAAGDARGRRAWRIRAGGPGRPRGPCCMSTPPRSAPTRGPLPPLDGAATLERRAGSTVAVASLDGDGGRHRLLPCAATAPAGPEPPTSPASAFCPTARRRGGGRDEGGLALSKRAFAARRPVWPTCRRTATRPRGSTRASDSAPVRWRSTSTSISDFSRRPKSVNFARVLERGVVAVVRGARAPGSG